MLRNQIESLEWKKMPNFFLAHEVDLAMISLDIFRKLSSFIAVFVTSFVRWSIVFFVLCRAGLQRLVPVYLRYMSVLHKCIIRMYPALWLTLNTTDQARHLIVYVCGRVEFGWQLDYVLYPVALTYVGDHVSDTSDSNVSCIHNVSENFFQTQDILNWTTFQL